MSSVHKKRLMIVGSLIIGLSLALGLILYALSQNINLFYSPSQLRTARISSGKIIRVGGMVVKNSVVRKNDLSVEFMVSDFQQQIKIHYQGILPDLFKEGQGIVALGKLDKDGEFQANQVLAKHDEKYMPPEVAASLKMAALTKIKE